MQIAIFTGDDILGIRLKNRFRRLAGLVGAVCLGLGVALVVLTAGTTGGALLAGLGLVGDSAIAIAATLGAGLVLAAKSEAPLKHIEFIQIMLARVETGESTAGAAPQLEPGERFAQRAEAEMLDQTVIESMVPDVAILRMAYLIERDFAEFYEQAAERVDGHGHRDVRSRPGRGAGADRHPHGR